MDFPNLQSRLSVPYIPPHKTQVHPRMHAFSSLPPPNARPPNYLYVSSKIWWVILSVLIFFSLFFYVLAIARGIYFSSNYHTPNTKSYGLIIDADYKEARIHVLEFFVDGRFPFMGFEGKHSNSFAVKPGLSAFERNPKIMGNSIDGLLEFARKMVPKKVWGVTKVQLIAHGGLRWLGSDSTELILESCRTKLRSSGFQFQDEWVSFLTGPDEGLYTWVAANYALGTLGGDPQRTTGIIKLGEDSTEVTFVPREPIPLEFSRTVKVSGVTYNLYSHSLLQFALHHGHADGVALDPCIPRGYTKSSKLLGNREAVVDLEFAVLHSAGNFSACRSEVLALFQKEQGDCSYPHCKIGSAFVPELQGNFFATEKFFHTPRFFGLHPRAPLSDFKMAGELYCGNDWSKLKEKNIEEDEEDLLKYCFSSAYIVALLHDALGVSMDDQRIRFMNQVGNVPLDWRLGAFILQSILEPDLPQEKPVWILGKDFLTFFSLFAIFVLVIVIAFSLWKWNKPQVKTIYDLEKGHYIITRIPR
ncbi:hypothetical protein AMTRI_Chr01g126390 [Amborella trichopoda]